jgi:ABC-2 type transport system ATP-binding protein
MIAARSLTRVFGRTIAVRELSLTIESGEMFALIGPDGAGKTTALEILEGLRRRDGGQVLVTGLDPDTGSRKLRRRLGIVLQQTALEPELTVKETVRAFSRYYQRPLTVDLVLDIAALRRVERQRVASLSRGQKRRLDIALGVIGDPEVLFLDEPVTGLDSAARHKIWRLLATLNGEGRTILLSSPDMADVEALAGRIAILLDGRILTSGRPHELQQALGPEPTIELYIGGDALPRLFPQALRAIARLEQGWVRLTCRDPGAAAYELLLWAVRNRYDLSSLTIARPSLAALYLQLTRRVDEEVAC